ncbi:MAG: di-heme oxidoredictase family protein [Alphaproteobacteria bacterium]|jgi:CxxC motif-containing protein (DUF1111 family)|nr:di-heme oxidoredictase family protein [Alphaproteobacteria bacterium]
MALWLALVVGLGARPSAAADTLAPLLDLDARDVWRQGGVNYAAEFNRWVWLNFSISASVDHFAPAALSAGDATSFLRSREAFSAPLGNLDPKRLRAFAFGRHLFRRNWVIAPSSVESLDGLGPTFNRVTCSGCHLKDGRGRPPASPDEPMKSMLVRLSVPSVGSNGGPSPHPVYGSQLQDKGIPGVPKEGRATIRYREIEGAFADGQHYRLRAPIYEFTELEHGPLGDDFMFSPRVAPAIHGLGLLEAVAEAVIEDTADPNDSDGDGISGKVNRVWDNVTGQERLGRFGWKANTASLHQQVAAAAFGDIGITTTVFPFDNCPPAQSACMAAPNGGMPELDDRRLETLVSYARSLGVPARRDLDNPSVRRGEILFASAGCASCHAPNLTTGAATVLPELAEQTIHPYTDLLLHDMGEGLADGRPDFEASGREWRTPPLWGIGLVQRVNLHQFFLHDGRARGFMEAVLWHGGEAEAAREAVLAMPKADRDALIAFLGSL